MRVLIEAANTMVAIEDGMIVDCVGTFEHCIKVPHGEVRPGLINCHDHLHRNHYGRLGAPLYDNAYAWAHDIQNHCREQIAAGRAKPRDEALRIGAWKNLIAGVTHVVHHDPWETAFDNGFPLHVVDLPCADSLGMSPDFAAPAKGPFALHVAEGIDAVAASEIVALHRRGLLNDRLLAVHVVGPEREGIAMLQQSGCAVIWCPTSNHFLFGRSAPDELLDGETDILLGTDSLLTGYGTLLDELRAARSVMPDARLLEAVGHVAARRLGLPPPGLMPGSRADLVVSTRPILESCVDDIILVMADGALRVLAPSLVDRLRPAGGRRIDAFGVTRWVNG